MLLEQRSSPGAIDLPAKQRVRDYFDHIAPQRPRFRRRNRYYYQELIKYLRFLIPPGKRVLEAGCGDGYVLRQLRPSRGLGIDFSGEMVRHAQELAAADGDASVQFCEADVETCRFDETFDFIVLSDLLGTLVDIQTALENLRSACDQSTRIVINSHSILWEPLLRVGAKLGMKMPQPPQNWLSPSDIDAFVRLCGYEVVKDERRLLMPRYVPLLSRLINAYLAPLPLVNSLCLSHFLVLRMRPRPPVQQRSVSIVIPCRNERGNIRAAIERIPAFGASQEILFVDGHSTDGTPEEIERAMADHPERDIKFLRQEGRGKGDAVRLGFSKAAGDVLMILDADLTMPPEDLPKFYQALVSGVGEFINGSRLVYPMEGQAMRPLNVLGNKFFSVALTWLVGQRLKDTLCGTKVLLAADYQRIADGRAFFGDFDPFGDFDLLFGASKLGLKIVEIPIRYRDRTYGSTNISRFRHGWLLLRMTAFAWRKLKRL